jgi:hypothetical protein
VGWSGTASHWLSGDQARVGHGMPNCGRRNPPKRRSLPPTVEMMNAANLKSLSRRKKAIQRPSGDQTGLNSSPG